MAPLMRRLAGALGLAGSAAAANGELVRPMAPDRTDLEDMRWHARPVLVFAPDTDDAAYRDQMRQLEAAEAALRERDIVVMTDTNPSAGGALRASMGIEDFAVLLIGKDGGVKLRQETPMSVAALAGMIDEMPMRQRETEY